MIIPILLLLSLSVAVIFSSNANLAVQQFIYALIGIVFYFFLSKFNYKVLRQVIKPLYLFILVCLVIVLILGIETRGSVRWISLGVFNFQPSEFAKPILILALAQFWSKHQASWLNILKSLLILGPFFGLVFKQPDLGTALTLLFIWLSILFAANISFLKIIILSGLGLIAIPISWIFLQEYQKHRVLSFLSPEQDPKGIGFHVIQSTIAVGSGGFFGRGLGRGTQSRLQFLPEFRTDFIFAFIAEELGFIGSAIVIVLYSLVFFFIFKTLSQINDRFGELICVGVMGMMFFQIIVNIGMNIGILPITGITLPFLSYGGSSVISTIICLGFVGSVAKFGIKKREISIISPLG
jgi:rod shape determining protein RodA